MLVKELQSLCLDIQVLDENGNQIELKDDDEDDYQPGRFRDDDFDRYQDMGSESDFAEAGYTMKEAQIENLVTAKGYTDCVAFMGEDSISVVVDTGTGELTAEDVAKITDIAMTETGYPASGIKIMASN